jgi:hypothetical protein
VAVVGCFDVPGVQLVRALARIRESSPGVPLAALVVGCGEAVLPLRVRAEMAAALAVVDYALPVEPVDLEGLLREIGPSLVVRREDEDHALNRQLKEHVRRR